MSTQPRVHGRYDSHLDDRALLDAVAQIAVCVMPEDPVRVSMPAFNRARAAAGRADCPTAEAVHMRLNRPRRGADARRLRWSQILALALTDGQRREPRLRAASREDASPHLGEEHVFYALRVVARELRAGTVARHQYDPARRALIRRDRRRHGDAAVLGELLPTLAQIDHLTGHEWNRALQMAGLAARPRGKQPDRARTGTSARAQLAGIRPRPPRRGHGVPEPVLIAAYAAVNRRWPGRHALLEFARACGIRLRYSGAPHRGHFTEAARLLRLAGLQVPQRLPQPTGAGWRPLDLYPTDGIAELAGPSADAHREIAIAGLQRWLASLPARAAQTRSAYLRWQVGSGWPAASRMDAWDGFAALRDEARRRNARHRPPAADPAALDRETPGDDQLTAILRRLASAPTRPLRPGASDGDDTSRRVGLAQLLDAGLLRPGDVLHGRTAKRAYTAIVQTDASIEVPGAGTAPTPSAAARLACGRTQSGWQFWHVERGAQCPSLDALRSEMAGRA